MGDESIGKKIKKLVGFVLIWLLNYEDVSYWILDAILSGNLREEDEYGCLLTLG